MSYKNICRKDQETFQCIIAKFLINLPTEQRKDLSRLSYHAEKAWYYYIDQESKNTKNLDSNRKQFFQKLQMYSPKWLNIYPDKIIQKLNQNKPTCGAIIFNQSQTKVFVIRSKYGLGFPKGKWNQSETAEQCAARETYEEVKIYIHQKIDPTQKIQFLHKQTLTIFFIVKGVKESQRTNIDTTEIVDAFWMNVEDVKKYKKKLVSKCRKAWEEYENMCQEGSLTFEGFLQMFRNPKVEQKKQSEEENPFLNFKLDRQRLMSVFAQ